MKPIINPSLMCADFLNIKSQIGFLNTKVDLYHFDIMDGHFVPNITLSPAMAEALAPVCGRPIDFHLMVTDPASYIEPCRKAVESLTERGIISYFSPHAETVNGYGFRILDQIKAAGFHAGIAINPETPLSMVEAYLHKLDKITFMSVDPGFSGQPFIPEVLDKIRTARKWKEEQPEKYHYIVEIDGSCNAKTYDLLAEAGVESLIVGTSGLFGNSPELPEAFEIMLGHLRKAGYE